eukprot:3281151-Pleurochrysis_carterae.AAC.4
MIRFENARGRASSGGVCHERVQLNQAHAQQVLAETLAKARRIHQRRATDRGRNGLFSTRAMSFTSTASCRSIDEESLTEVLEGSIEVVRMERSHSHLFGDRSVDTVTPDVAAVSDPDCACTIVRQLSRGLED